MTRALKANEAVQMVTGSFSATLESAPAVFSYSADGKVWADWKEQVTDRVVTITGMPENMFIRFSVAAELNWR